VADDAAAKILVDLHGSILNRLKPLVILSGVVVLGLVANAAWSGRVNGWFVAQACAGGTMAVGVLERWPHRVRTLSLTVGMGLLSLCALASYGPLLGVGLVFAVTTLAAATFFRARGAFLCTGLLIGGLGAVWLGVGSGAIHPGLELDRLQWARIAFSVAVTLVCASYVFVRLEQATRTSIERQLAALDQQRVVDGERERLLRAVANSQRLESLGRLASGVAHDFNTALAVVVAGVEALRESPDPAERTVILDDIERSAEAATATARQLISFSKGNPIEKGDCAAAPLLERFRLSLQRVVPDNIAVTVERAPTRETSRSRRCSSSRSC